MEILLAAAAAFATPKLLELVPSYPDTAARARSSAAAYIEMVVDPAGRSIDCRTLATFGDDHLAKMICKLQSGATFQPAKNDTGEPSYGIARVLVRYFYIGSKEGPTIQKLEAPGVSFELVGAMLQSPVRLSRIPEYEPYTGETVRVSNPDLTLDVEALPGASGSTLDRRVLVTIDTEGQVDNCTADPADTEISGAAAYSAAACQMVGDVPLAPLVVNGQAVSYVRPLEVRFSVAANN